MVVEVSSDQEGRKGEKSKHNNKRRLAGSRDGRIVCVLEGNCGLPTKLVPKLMSLFSLLLKSLG
jgi:hypothetical protein